MKDHRLKKLACLILDHSLEAKPRSRVLMDAQVTAKPLVKYIMQEACARGILVIPNLLDEEVRRLYVEALDMNDGGFTEESVRLQNEWELARLKHIHGYINLRGPRNDMELADVDRDKVRYYHAHRREITDAVTSGLPWVLFEYPVPGQAQKAGMAYDRFFDYVMDVTLVDYQRMYEGELQLAKRMSETDRVEIKGPGTDLTFSIRGMPQICCFGRRNLPDGEVYTAPVLDSANGIITYNVASNYWDRTFDKVYFEMKDGRIVDFGCNGNREELAQILNTDSGARRIGEFSFGLNPSISQPAGNVLFDEKIHGSFHFTPGNAYSSCFNGNKSAVHWDLVCIQRQEYGGGEIRFDGMLIRKDGKFVLEELEKLNPENLKSQV